MTDRRRWIWLALFVVALVALVLPVMLRAQDQDNRADELATYDLTLTSLVEQNRGLIAENAEQAEQLEELIGRLDSAEKLSTLAACRATNQAQVVTRELATAITDTMVDYLASSPHAPETVTDIAVELHAKITVSAEADQDCTGDGVLDDADYP